MMNIKGHKKLAFLASMLLALSLSGCVEQDVSMSLAGSVLFEGDLNEETGELRCDTGSAKAGSVEQYFQAGRVNLSQGAPLYFNAEIVNLLDQSNQSSSGGETFPGISKDQNSIRVTKANIRFPASLNNFDGANLAAQYLEKSAVFSVVIDSGNGAAISIFELMSLRDFGDITTFYDEAVAAAGLAAGTSDAIIPLVAEIQIEGETFGGETVESNIFQFPIDLCKDCEIDTTPQCVRSE